MSMHVDTVTAFNSQKYMIAKAHFNVRSKAHWRPFYSATLKN